MVDVNLYGNRRNFMSELTYSELRKGMHVTLTNPSPDYTIGKGNPKVGTKWECVGKVVEMCDGSIDVRWENGAFNTYKSRELSVAHGGRCKSIWEED
jgi:hypothetical protein